MNTFGKISNLDSELLEQVISLDLNLMDYPWRPGNWVDLDWENHQLFIIANNANQVLAFALFHHLNSDTTAHLLKICVTEMFRGTGLSIEFFNQSFETLALRGANSIYLEVEEGNLRAISFYKKLGFQLLKSVKGYYSDGKNALTMFLAR